MRRRIRCARMSAWHCVLCAGGPHPKDITTTTTMSKRKGQSNEAWTKVARTEKESDEEDNYQEDADDLDLAAAFDINPQSKVDTKAPVDDASKWNELEQDLSAAAQLFNLQVAELIKEVDVPYDKLSSINSAIKLVTETINSITETEITLPNKSVNVPTFGTDPNRTYKINPPTSVDVVGSFSSRTIVRPYESVDIVIQTQGAKRPFHRNFHYIDHRNIYLWHLASILDKVPRFHGRCKFEYIDQWRIALVVKPKKDPETKLKTNFIIRLHTTTVLDKGLHAFLPSHQNIDLDSLKFATPHYNSAVLSDLFYKEQTAVITNSIRSCPPLRTTILLFKVWLRQRSKAGWPNTFQISSILSHLLALSIIRPGMTPHTMFKLALGFFDKHDFTSDKVVMIQINPPTTHMPSGAELWSIYKEHFPVVVVDATGQNLMHNVSASGYKEFMQSVKLSLEQINSTSGFEPLFLHKVTFEEDFDIVLRVPLSGPKANKDKEKEKILQREWDLQQFTSQELTDLLERALTDRVHSIFVFPDPPSTWSLSKKKAEYTTNKFNVGLKLRPENSWKTMVSGPSADDAKAAGAFVALWGNKTEVRRFKDGRIIRAIIFEEPVNRITPKILEHLLLLHYQVSPASIDFISCFLDPLLYGNGCSDIAPRALGPLQELNSKLRSLDLPLRIIHIISSDPALRGTDPAPPRPVSESSLVNYYTRPLYIILQMESTNEWPREFDPLQKVKAAFYSQIAKALHGDMYKAAVTESGLTMWVEGGDFRFNLVIQHPYEVSYMTQEQLPQSLIHEHSIEYFYKPLHHTQITGACGRFACFGPVCKLAKRWIAANMMSNHFHEEAIELIVAYLFIHPAPFTVPGSPVTGFLRFLKLVATFSWHSAPLIVNLDGSLTSQDYSNIYDWNNNRRNKAMYIACSYDQGSGWTLNMPTTVVVNRLVETARASLRVLQVEGQSSSAAWRRLFEPVVEHFPISITIKNNKYISRRYQALKFVFGEETLVGRIEKESFIALGTKDSSRQEDPVAKMIRVIEKNYTGVSCFYNPLGGTVVGVAFDSTIHPGKLFSSSIGYAVQDSNIAVNVGQLVEDLNKMFGKFGEVKVADSIKKQLK